MKLLLLVIALLLLAAGVLGVAPAPAVYVFGLIVLAVALLA